MTGLDPIPSLPLPVVARAPGKCILFGEHAVVHGGPELVAAIDLFVQVGVSSHPRTRLNADPDAPARNPYLREALARYWAEGPPVDLTATSRVPKSAGLGSSAAFSAALLTAFAAASGGIARPHLAERAFEIERAAQGVGSPGDTSAAVGGGYLSINATGAEELWGLTDGTQRWSVRRVRDPGWAWVVAYSGIPRNTAETVRAVTRRLSRPDGAELLERFRRVALDGIRAVAVEDRASVGPLLTENHALLADVGVSHPRLEEMIRAAAPAAEGAKLTGAGAGGSIVLLAKPGRELEAARRIARVGGVSFVVRVEPGGARLVTKDAG